MTSKAHMKNIKENFFNKKVATFGNGWKLHIDTLSSFYGFNPGSYVMTVVKNISASDNFLSLADNKKKCMDNVYEECKNKRLLRKLQENFGCTPLGLSLTAIKDWVSFSAGNQLYEL